MNLRVQGNIVVKSGGRDCTCNKCDNGSEAVGETHLRNQKTNDGKRVTVQANPHIYNAADI
jgi:hypothetical protein